MLCSLLIYESRLANRQRMEGGIPCSTIAAFVPVDIEPVGRIEGHLP